MCTYTVYMSCTWVATVLIKIVWNERNKGEKKIRRKHIKDNEKHPNLTRHSYNMCCWYKMYEISKKTCVCVCVLYINKYFKLYVVYLVVSWIWNYCFIFAISLYFFFSRNIQSYLQTSTHMSIEKQLMLLRTRAHSLYLDK